MKQKNKGNANFCFILIFFVVTVFAGCVSFEATAGANIDIESYNVDYAMGYNKEDAFNLLAFWSFGFLLTDILTDTPAIIYSAGLEYEHYFTDIIGISGRVGYRYKQHYIEMSDYSGYTISEDGFLLQLGVPFSWSYGKITPYAGVVFYDKPKFNIGISLALRNQAVAILFIPFIALGGVQQKWKKTGMVYGNNGYRASIYTRDIEQEEINKENAANSIKEILKRVKTAEDKKPYPAWKWRAKYEGIYWKNKDAPEFILPPTNNNKETHNNPENTNSEKENNDIAIAGITEDVREPSSLPPPPTQPSVNVTTQNIPEIAYIPKENKDNAIAGITEDVREPSSLPPPPTQPSVNVTTQNIPEIAYIPKENNDNAIADNTGSIRQEHPVQQNPEKAPIGKRTPDSAIADYTAAIRRDPNNAEAYAGRGAVFAEKGDYDSALADYNQALRLNPNDAGAYSKRGAVYAGKGNYNSAIADYNQAIKLDPNNAEAYNNRGLAYDSKGDYNSAIADYNQAIKLNPNNADAYYNRALIYDNKGDYKNAGADYEAALRLDPNHALAKYMLEVIRQGR